MNRRKIVYTARKALDSVLVRIPGSHREGIYQRQRDLAIHRYHAKSATFENVKAKARSYLRDIGESW